MPIPLYGTIFYGGGSFYGPSGIDVPVDVRFYRTNTDGVYVFHWGFQYGYVSAALENVDFQLDICEDPSFTGPTLVSYLSTSPGVIQYQNGNIRKGYAINVNPRIDKVEQPWYARVAVVNGSLISDWSDTLQFIIPQRWEIEEAENFMNNLPDYHVYGKEDLLKAISARNSNLWVVGDMYGREFDQVLLENLLTTTNNFIDLCRDEQLYDNFGVFFNYVKPQNQVFIEYREVIRTMILGSLVGGTIAAIQSVVTGFAGVPASIELIRDRGDFFLNTDLVIPPEPADGARTFFSSSSELSTTTVTAVISNPVTYAYALIQDLKYTAVFTGNGGNSISIEYVADATVGTESVVVLGSAITVHIAPTGTTAARIREIVLDEPLATALVDVTIVGIETTSQVAPIYPTLPIVFLKNYPQLAVVDATGFLQEYSLIVNGVSEVPLLDIVSMTLLTVDSVTGISVSDVLTQGQPFIEGSMRVLKNGIRLLNPADFTEQAFTPGINTTTPPMSGSFSITAIGDATSIPPFQNPSVVLTVSSTAGMIFGQTIVQGSAITRIDEVLSPTTIHVYDTTGFSIGVATWRDTIEMEYDFGQTGDPVPLIFDIEDRTALTGTVSFTHNGIAVTGVGTLFLTELTPGNTVTDSQGLILGEVATVTDDFNFVLADPWLGDTGSGVAYRLTYGEI